MKHTDKNLLQEAKEYAHNLIEDWDLEHPEPTKPPHEPKPADAKFLKTQDGFLVVDPHGSMQLTLHVTVKHKYKVDTTIGIGTLRELIECLLEAESALTSHSTWLTDSRKLRTEHNKWSSSRARKIEKLMKQYIDQATATDLGADTTDDLQADSA